MVLQTPREFVGICDRLKLVVAGFRAELLLVERAHELELPLLLGGGEAGVAHVAQAGLDRLLPGATDRGALINGGEKRAAVVARSAVGERRTQRDKRRQIFALRAETVGDPRAHRGADKIGGAGVEKQRRGPVRHTLRVHRADNAVIVGQLRHVRKQIRDPASALPALLEIPHRLHHAARRADAGLGDRALVEEVHHLAVVLIELGLVVEAIEVAHAAAHEEEDHALRPRSQMARLGDKGIGRAACGGLRSETGKCHVAETARELLQGLTTGKEGIRVHGKTGLGSVRTIQELTKFKIMIRV